MEPERRRQILLAALAIVLALVVYQAWPRTSAEPRPASNERRAAAPTTAEAPAGAGTRAKSTSGTAGPPGGTVAPDVHLEALEAERPKPGDADRNLFRFKSKAPPPPPPGPTKPTTAPPVAVAPVPMGPPPPPPVPPITLKFIGVAEQEGRKIAVLTDGVGQPVYGAEGAVVLGRYRILKIGVESVEIAYADGRGRQTIRLTGS